MVHVLILLFACCASVDAQGVSSLINKDSTPTESVIGRLIEASFVSSPDVLRRLHSRSNFSASQAETLIRLSKALSVDAIRRESTPSPEAIRIMDRDSEFSELTLKALQNRSEYRNGGLVQAVSPAFEDFVKRHSEPSMEEVSRMVRALNSEAFREFLSRNSTSSQPGLYRTRSIPSKSEFRLLINRSID